MTTVTEFQTPRFRGQVVNVLADANGFTTNSAWSNKYTTFGPDTIANPNAAAVAIGYDVTGGEGGIISLTPGSAWNAFSINVGSLRVRISGSTALQIDGSNNVLARGVAYCTRATAIETRASTTTLTNSTQLTYAIPAAGTYEFELVVYSYFTTAVTDGMTANVNYSGTFTAVGSYLCGDLMNGTTTDLGIQPVEVSATVNNALAGLTLATYGASVAAATPAVHKIKGQLIATGTGTLAFAFAQAVSGVDTCNLGVGSWMKVTQLS